MFSLWQHRQRWPPSLLSVVASNQLSIMASYTLLRSYQTGNTSSDLCGEPGLANILLYFLCLIGSLFHPVCLWN